MNQKDFLKIILVLIVVILAGAAYWYWADEINLTLQTYNWKTYRNDEFGFELKHPKNYAIVEERFGKTFDGINEWVIVNLNKGDNNLYLEINRGVGDGIGVCAPDIDSHDFVNPYNITITKSTWTNYLAEPEKPNFGCEKKEDGFILYFFGGPLPKHDAFRFGGHIKNDENNVEFEKLAELILNTFRFIKK